MEPYEYLRSSRKSQMEADKQKTEDYKKAFLIALVLLPIVWVLVSLYLLVFPPII